MSVVLRLVPEVALSTYALGRPSTVLQSSVSQPFCRFASTLIATIVAYTTSKFALLGLTKSVCLSHAKDGLRVNGIAPGVIDTPLLSETYRNDFNTHLIPQVSCLTHMEPN